LFASLSMQSLPCTYMSNTKAPLLAWLFLCQLPLAALLTLRFAATTLCTADQGTVM